MTCKEMVSQSIRWPLSPSAVSSWKVEVKKKERVRECVFEEEGGSESQLQQNFE